MSDKKTCLIAGVGPGTGLALARRFAEGGYEVAMLARRAERLAGYEKTVPGTRAYVCDVGNPEDLAVSYGRVCEEMGTPEVVIHNAPGGAFGSFLDIEPEILERNFRTNTMGLYHLARLAAPSMMERGSGVILCTGNTSAHRGVPNFAGFAPTKAAQRILAESIARTLSAKGVHVAYITIDAVIAVPWALEMFKDKPREFFIEPEDIAAECFHTAHQPRSAWSFNVEIRPFGESW